MDSRGPAEVGPPEAAADFVRFCYRRRRLGWPELYDEMCAVAGRALYRGWGFNELADHGIAFSLFELPRLAAIAARVAADERDHRGRPLVAVMAVGSVEGADLATSPVQGDHDAAASSSTEIVQPVAVRVGLG